MAYQKMFNIDCLEGYKLIDDNSVHLQIIDAPYFSTGMDSVGDNQWKTELQYLEWFKDVLIEVKRTLSKNGSIYIFHNDESIMIDVLYFCKHNLHLYIQNQITWNKFPTHNNFSRVIKTFGKNRRFSKTFTEKIYFLTNQADFYETPFSKIIREKINNGILKKDISNLFLSKNGKQTGWLFNKIKGSQIPTREQWETMCDFFNIKNEYDSLVSLHNQERYRFNQNYGFFSGKSISEQKEMLKPYSEIWEYEKDETWHPTRKPYKMIENLVKISTNDNEIVLDPFMGSGVTSEVCKFNNRNFIGFEKNSDYFNRLIHK